MSKRRPRWRKVESGSYQLRDGDSILAYVFLGGAYGRDDYPWDWYLSDKAHVIVEHPSGIAPRTTGCTETKREAVEIIEWLLGLNEQTR